MEEGIQTSVEGIVTTILFFCGLAVSTVLFHRELTRQPDRKALTAVIAARSWNVLQVAILLGTLFLLYFLAAFTGRFFYEEQIPLVKLIVTILIYAILMALILFTNRGREKNWKFCPGMSRCDLKLIWLAPVIYLASIPFLMLISQAYHLLLEYFFTTELDLQDVAKMAAGELSILDICYLAVAITLAPIYEELMFRGIIFPYLTKHTNLVKAVLLVSVLFAFMHFHLPSFLALMFLSVVLCLAYWRTGSLWVSIGIHAIWNTITILALNLSG